MKISHNLEEYPGIMRKTMKAMQNDRNGIKFVKFVYSGAITVSKLHYLCQLLMPCYLRIFGGSSSNDAT